MPGNDFFNSTNPAHSAAAITPHDTNEIGPYRSLYVGVSGDIVLITVGDDTVTITAAPVGILPIYTKVVKATSTTATNIVGLN